MHNFNSPDDAAPPSPATGRLSEAERRALRERAAQARAAATEAIARYVALMAQSRQRLATVTRNSTAVSATLDMLRQSVQRYALLKANDTPPERMLRLVKEVLAEKLPHSEHEADTRALVEGVVTWCIEAYYADSPAA